MADCTDENLARAPRDRDRRPRPARSPRRDPAATQARTLRGAELSVQMWRLTLPVAAAQAQRRRRCSPPSSFPCPLDRLPGSAARAGPFEPQRAAAAARGLGREVSAARGGCCGAVRGRARDSRAVPQPRRDTGVSCQAGAGVEALTRPTMESANRAVNTAVARLRCAVPRNWARVLLFCGGALCLKSRLGGSEKLSSFFYRYLSLNKIVILYLAISVP